jgi:D-alanine-D-alanine ligase
MRTINKEKILAQLGHVVVLKGGTSVEREISLISGNAVLDGLQRMAVNVSSIDVGDNIVADLEQAKPDLVFNMLHGKGGEDGVIQGCLEVMRIPYTGSGVLASALAMDKVKSKLIWQQLGLSTAEFVILDQQTDWQEVIERLGKVVVKPVNGGSSLGISIVDNAEDMREQYTNARQFDSQVMAEKCIEGQEFSAGVLGDQLFPTVQLETNREFLDFEAKYSDENSCLIGISELSDAKQAELEELILDAYRSLNCTGLARVDLMQDKDGKFYLLELNTVPGMTEHSFVPISAEKIGISFDDLLLQILEVELENADK